MSLTPAAWVHDEIRAYVAELGRSSKVINDADAVLMQRLIADPQMQKVYSSDYLLTRLTPIGWRFWFDCARGVNNQQLERERHRLQTYAKLIAALSESLGEVADLMGEIEELDAGEVGRPSMLSDPFALMDAAAKHPYGRKDGTLPYLFDAHIKPEINKLSQFDIGRYVPSVPLMLKALAHEVSFYSYEIESKGPVSGFPELASVLSKREARPLPKYVRFFDAAMKYCPLKNSTGDRVDQDRFLMPPVLLATQASAFLAQDVTPFQITSARKTARLPDSLR